MVATPTTEKSLDDLIAELTAIIDDLLARMVEAAAASLLPEVLVGSIADAEGEARRVWQQGIEPISERLAAVYHAGSMANWIAGPRSLSRVNPDKWGRVVAVDAVDYMRQASNRLAGVGDTAWRDLRTLIANEIEAGSTTEQVKQMLERGGKDGFFPTELRADTIARTEMNSAYNQGHLAGARAFGADGPSHKQWVATNGRRTRPTHAEADGKIVPIDAKFSVGGHSMDGPGDPSGGASEVVNCRCTLILLYPDDPALDGLTDDGSDAEVVGKLDATQERPPKPPQDPYDYKVATIRDLSNYDDWRASTDPAIRSSALWQHTYQGQQFTRQVRTNIRKGLDPLDGLLIDDVNSHVYISDKLLARLGYTGYGEPPLFSADDLLHEFRRAGEWVDDQLDHARVVSSVPQYRGMVVDDIADFADSLDDTFDMPLASFTPSKDEALRYTMPRQTFDSPQVLNGRVLVEMRPGAQVVDLAGKGTGPMRTSKETLFEGTVRVVSKKKGSDGILRIVVEAV